MAMKRKPSATSIPMLRSSASTTRMVLPRNEIRRIQKEGVDTVSLCVQAVRIGDVILYGMPGEIYVEFGFMLKEKSPLPAYHVRQPGKWLYYEARACCSIIRWQVSYDRKTTGIGGCIARNRILKTAPFGAVFHLNLPAFNRFSTVDKGKTMVPMTTLLIPCITSKGNPMTIQLIVPCKVNPYMRA